jgi:Beta-galactosidase
MSLRIRRAAQPLTGQWQDVAIEPRRSTRLGISFRPLQAEAMGLQPRSAMAALLEYPYELVRLAAHWNRMEPAPDVFDPLELDWQIDAAEGAGKQVLIGVGAVKNFGYPELFVPEHRLGVPLREGSLISRSSHPALLAAAVEFVTRVVERYRDRPSIIAWQVEHEAVDPLGMEHSWRLATSFVEQEIAAVRKLDAKRPILLNGFLPMSLPVALFQWWRTRDQGDSLSLAWSMADIVGVDLYPCHAMAEAGGLSFYMKTGERAWDKRSRRLLAPTVMQGQRMMITEGQAEPWESVTIPPNALGQAMASCPPESVIENYSRSMRWARQTGRALDAYLFWGAEYWLLRRQGGDDSYLGAFERILNSDRA